MTGFRGTHGCLWRSISTPKDIFGGCMQFEEKDGSRVRIWHNQWCGKQSLKERYPELYAIKAAKDAIMLIRDLNCNFHSL